MKKTLIAAIVAAMVSAPAWSQNAILQNEYVRAGVNQLTGTFGSGGNTSPGLLYDNTGTSTFNTAYDYLTPGSPFDGFAVKVDGTNYNNNNAGNTRNITGGWTSGTTTSATTADWSGSFTHATTTWGVRNLYSLPAGQPFIDITSTITAGSAASQVWFGRYIDPDARAAAGDSSRTDNVIGYGTIPTRNIVFSEALASRYALGLYSTNSNAYAGIQGWTQQADGYQTSYYGPNFGSGDDTIGLSWVFNGVSAGDIMTVNYAYIFGPNAFGAASTAISGGAGGGDTSILTGTLIDVGSATDAASSPSTPPAPTVTGTTTTTVTVSDTTVVNTGLPVLTASLAHHNASESSGVQTIARETTTNVTTPYTRTVTTVNRTVTTYSDSTTTTTDSAPTVTNTLVNNVTTTVANDSFGGRIDQMSELANLNKQLDRSLNMDAFRQDGVTKDDVTVYINAASARSSMANDYSAKNQIYGIGAEKAINSNWRLGVQYNRVNSTMNGIDSNTAQDKNHYGLFSVLDVDGFKIVNNLGYSDNTVRSNRTIRGIDFNNSHSTRGNDLWLNNRVYAPAIEGFRPFVGVTAGRSTVNGYTEAGSIQSARTVGKTVNNYTYGEAGVRYEKAIDDFRLMGEVGQTTDNYTTGSVTVGYKPTKDGMIAVTGTTQKGNNITTNAITVRGIIRF